ESQDPQEAQVHQQIHQRDDSDGEEQASWDVPSAVADLGGDEGGVVPTTVGVQNENERQAETAARGGADRANLGRGQEQSGGDDQHQAHDFGGRQYILGCLAGGDAQQVDDR